MSQYLRLIHGLLTSLGGTASPEIFPLAEAETEQRESPSLMDLKKGKKTFVPTEFAFFQGSLARAYIIGHIAPPEGNSLPIVFTILASGILIRDTGELKPYVQPLIRETVLLPRELPFGEKEVQAFVDAGLDIERYDLPDKSYKGIRINAARKAMDILAEVKEGIYLTFCEAVGNDSFMVLVDGSLRPSDVLVAHGNWVGLSLNPLLSPVEENVSLKLGENQIGPPFKLTRDGRAYFWHLRMLSDLRKGPGWGIVRIDNALSDGEDMQSKVESVSGGILAERYPIHPASRTEGWGLYPLITARVFLNTQTTSETAIMKYF